MRLWYQLTSPPEPETSASFLERELFRRGRTCSQISIFLFILIFISYPAAFAGSNSLLIGILTANIFILMLALVLNHLRRVNIAGVLVVLSVIASPMANIVTTPGGMNTSILPIFTFLVLPVMCAVSFLPPGWVFVVVAANSLFTVYILKFLPSTGELHTVLDVAFIGIVTPIILSQWIVAVVAFLWVRGAKLAILRADRAEDVNVLLRQMAEQNSVLDRSIGEIERVHQEVANGNIWARVQITQGNVLWSISGKLNNLLSRFQRQQQHIVELQGELDTLQATYAKEVQFTRTHTPFSESDHNHIENTSSNSGTHYFPYL